MSPNGQPQDPHEDLLAERGAEYGDSYAQTDRWVKEHLQELAASPSPLGLIMIHFKLSRALATPRKRDHYDDLIGYAKLVLRALEQPANHWLVEDARDEGKRLVESALERAISQEEQLKRIRYAQGRG